MHPAEPEIEICRHVTDADGHGSLAQVSQPVTDPDDPRRQFVILPGMLTNRDIDKSSADRAAEAMIRYIAEALEHTDTEPMPDLYSLVYPHYLGAAYAQGHLTGSNHRDTPREELTEAHQLVERVLLPRMVLVPGAPPPDLRTACQRLSRLTLVSYSLGTNVAAEAGRIFNERLRDAGYNTMQAAQICREVVSIQIANAARTDGNDGFRTITFGAQKDPTVRYFVEQIPGSPDMHQKLYRSLGYPDADTLPMRKHKPTAMATRLGTDIRYPLPDHIEWMAHKKPRRLDQSRIDEEFNALLARNPEIRDPFGRLMTHSIVTPQHDVRMAMIPTATNQDYVNHLGDALHGAAIRRVTTRGTWRQQMNSWLPSHLTGYQGASPV